MKQIYIAAPYTGDTRIDVEYHIHLAREIGWLTAREGLYPVIPHSNTSHFDTLQTPAWWYAATLEQMRRCDGGLFLRVDHVFSEGVRGEFEEATRLHGFPTEEIRIKSTTTRHQRRVAALEAVNRLKKSFKGEL